MVPVGDVGHVAHMGRAYLFSPKQNNPGNCDFGARVPERLRELKFPGNCNSRTRSRTLAHRSSNPGLFDVGATKTVQGLPMWANVMV